ncbi:PAS domain S-box protein [Spirulina sp. CCNP1310]|uniref:PAS domain S-box protein n=1 Tax=Spirulina sp. CCNP1310 TaxID=3110249 RepID=UPI002B1F098B|nr:PAS domain S-box protein [Spirulina sp. CCNP1310]MEA5419919.1 PAS domain S-box protein [Spirulina sp. CCNP1310]
MDGGTPVNFPNLDLSLLELKGAILPHPLMVTAETSVREAIALMGAVHTQCQSDRQSENSLSLEARASCVVIVVEEDRVCGILTERDVVRLSAQQYPLDRLAVGEVMVQPVITCCESEITDLFSTIALLKRHQIRHLPIVDRDNRLIGIVTHESLRQQTRPIDLLRLRSVEEVMSDRVLTAGPEQSMLEIARLMAERRVSSVVITLPGGRADAPFERAIGLLTERDLVQFQALGLSLTATPARTVMSSPVFTISPQESLWTVQQIMEKHRIRRMIVAGEQGELLGIVTQTSMLKAFNPLELYHLAEVLEQKVTRLEAERISLLEIRAAELEQQVAERTAVMQVQAERDRLMARLAAQILASLDVQVILDTTVQQVWQILGCDRVNIWRLDPDGTAWIVAESTHSEHSLIGEQITDSCVQEIQVDVDRQGAVRVVPDIYSTQMSDEHREMLIRIHTRAKILVPLFCEGEPWGLLNVTESQPRNWQTSEIELMRSLSIQLGIALQQATHHQQLQAEIRDRHRAQQELAQLNAELEARYRALMEGASDAILLATPAGQIIEANTAAEELFGYSRQALTQLHYAQLYPPEELERMTKAFEKLITKEQHRTLLNAHILHADGHQIPVDLSGTIITVGDTTVVQGIFRDITARQAAEAELAKLSQRLSIALSSGSIGCWDWDIAQNRITWDERMYCLYGVEYQGQAMVPYDVWANGVHPEDRPQIETLLQQTVAREAEYDCEFRVIHPDGSLHYIRAYGMLVQDAAGNPQSIIGVNLDVTRMHQAQLELKESETRFRRVFASDVVGMMFTNFSGEVTDANDRFLEMLGYSREEMESGQLNWANLTPPEYQQQDIEAIYHLMTYHSIQPFEKIYIHKDGHPVPVLLGVAMLSDEEETCVCVVVDISDHKRYENALQESQLRLELALESSNTGLWDWNMENNALWFNKQWKGMLGYGEHELANHFTEWESRIHPDDLAHTYQDVEQHIQGQTEVYRNEHRLRCKDDSYRWILAQGRIVERDATGKPLRFIGTHTDISDRKNNELERQKLLQELESFKFALDQSAIVLTTDIKGGILYVNERFESISGYSYEEIFGKSPHIVNSDHHPQQFFAQMWTTILAGRVWRDEICNRTKNGEIYWVDSTIIPFLNAQGQPTRFLSVQFDITTRKKVELDLADSNSLLSTITHAQAQFITAANRLTIFEGLLNSLLELTNSEYGFIGEVLFRGNGTAYIEENLLKIRGVPYLQSHSITNIAWDAETEKFYQDNYQSGMQFTNLKTLFGAVILTGKPVIANHAPTDPRRGGIPKGHPPLNAFLGIPFFKGNELIGMVGIANRPGGYDPDLIEQLQPFLTTCSNLIEGYRLDRMRQQAEALIAQQLRQQTALELILRQIRQSLDLPEILAIATQQVQELLQSDRVIVFQVCTDGHSAIVAEAVGADLPSLKTMNWEDESWPQEVLEHYWQGQPRIVPDVMDDRWTDCLREYSQAGQIQSKIIAPILQELHSSEDHRWVAPRTNNKLWGVLVVHACHQQRVWQESEAQLLQQIANQLAIAIQQSHLFEQLQQELSERQQAQTQLTQRNQELIRATRLKDEFLANMSHELRTPLNAILGMTEGLQEGVFGAVNSGQVKALNTIERSGCHLLALINDILDVAKIESGQVELECAPTAVAPLCQSSITFVKQQALKKQIQLVVNLPAHLPDIVLDERRIRQVLINLLNNAVKFTPPGGCITLAVTLTPPAQNATPDLRFAISDTGIGISGENLKKLFQPFIQIDSALNRQYQGTGLGLALTKQIVELHGGQVGVTSEVGTGSCFTIDLPYQASVVLSAPITSQNSTDSPALEAKSPVGRVPVLLLAEDNEANISTISSYLTAKGYHIEVVKNGQDAIDQAIVLAPDLILMDVQMPGMDGLQAIQQIRKITDLASTPIIALTALAMDSDRDRCFAAGANQYLSKPVKLKQLALAIQELITS